MNNQELITKFYESFQKRDAEGMVNCYHENISFEDPAFGVLQGERAKNMWRMLVSRLDENATIQFSNVQVDETKGSAEWKATYLYSATNRQVVNRIKAAFEFKDGKIIKHKDDFNLWSWTKQALGTSGYLLGWSGFMKKKIQKMANSGLDKFIKEL